MILQLVSAPSGLTAGIVAGSDRTPVSIICFALVEEADGSRLVVPFALGPDTHMPRDLRDLAARTKGTAVAGLADAG